MSDDGQDDEMGAMRDRIDRAMGLLPPLDPPGDGREIIDRIKVSQFVGVGEEFRSWGAERLEAGPKSVTSTWREFFADARYLGRHRRGPGAILRWSMGMDNEGVAWLVGQAKGIEAIAHPPGYASILACRSLPALKLAWAESGPNHSLEDMANLTRAKLAMLEAQEIDGALAAPAGPERSAAKGSMRI